MFVTSAMTTDLGPRVSALTRQAYGLVTGEARAKIDFTDARLGIRVASSAATATGADGLTMDGEIALFYQSDSSCSLVIRSGNSIINFDATGVSTI